MWMKGLQSQGRTRFPLYQYLNQLWINCTYSLSSTNFTKAFYSYCNFSVTLSLLFVRWIRFKQTTQNTGKLANDTLTWAEYSFHWSQLLKDIQIVHFLQIKWVWKLLMYTNPFQLENKKVVLLLFLLNESKELLQSFSWKTVCRNKVSSFWEPRSLSLYSLQSWTKEPFCTLTGIGGLF